MFFLSGITGQIGSAAADALLARGKSVRALVRDRASAQHWANRGVDLREGDLRDAGALAAALDGVAGAFLMQPTPMGVTRGFPEAQALTDALVVALNRKPPPRAVVLSSVGSEQASGLGNITQTHLLEQALAAFDLPLAIVRAGALLENTVYGLQRAAETGVYDSFLQPVDRGFPMVATTDVGAEVARLLVEGWDGRRIVEAGSYVSPAELAQAMSVVLGISVEAKAIPRAYWPVVLAQMGLSPEQAENWEAMQDSFNSGWIDFGRPGTEAVTGTTTLAEFFENATRRQRKPADAPRTA